MIGVWGCKTEGPPSGNSSSEFDIFGSSRYAYASRDVRACVRQINRARSVQGSRNQAEARAIWAHFPTAVPHARVLRPEDMAMFFLHVFCIRLQPYSKVLEDMERT